MIRNLVIVGMGGALGAIARVALSEYLPTTLLGLPLPIMLINILGCFIMGFLIEFMAFHGSFPAQMKYFLISGFLGGFTTFSSFALEYGLLFQKHAYSASSFYVIFSVGFSLLAFFIGVKIASSI